MKGSQAISSANRHGGLGASFRSRGTACLRQINSDEQRARLPVKEFSFLLKFPSGFSYFYLLGEMYLHGKYNLTLSSPAKASCYMI